MNKEVKEKFYNLCFITRFLREKHLEKKRKKREEKRRLKHEKNIEFKLKVMEFYRDSKDIEIKEILDYLKVPDREIGVFNYEDMNVEDIKVDVFLDKIKERFYVEHQGKKMYFPKKFDSIKSVETYYKGILNEQSKNSPHLYITEKFNVNGSKCLLDIGGAEGFFALENLDKVEKIYIFECEENWIEALENTFEPYKDKVQIIKKYVSDKNSDNEITLDNFQNSISERIDFIKMDIEGAEISALRGAEKILKENENLKLVVCTYHKENDEKDIKNILHDFKVETSKRYMLFIYDKDLKAPYFRRGVIRAESREQRAESREQRAESREQRAESREQRAESREQRAESNKF